MIILTRFFFHYSAYISFKPTLWVISALFLSACQTSIIPPQTANLDPHDSIELVNTPEDTAKSAQKSEQPSNQISYNSKVDNTPSAEVLFSTTTPSVIVTDPPPESAESIAEKIANNNSLAWSELVL